MSLTHKGTITLETERLILRQFTPEDYQDLFEYLSDEETIKYEPYGPITFEQSKEWAVARSDSDAFLAVCLRENGKLIGNLFMQKQEQQTYELGYVFNRIYWHKGYATEAVNAAIKYVFRTEKAHRIHAQCNPVNTASWKLLERIGFGREGFLKSNIYFNTDEDGKPIWQDTCIYAMTADDYFFGTIISIRDNPQYYEQAVDYFSTKWGIDRKIYEESITDAINTDKPLPRWYLMLRGDDIIGSYGLIENDFMVRKDLMPWLCALYVEESERGKALGAKLLEHGRQEVGKLGFDKAYLCTDHVGYYEKFGWSFFGMEESEFGGDTRVYSINASKPNDFWTALESLITSNEMNDNLKGQLEFLVEADKMKSILRQTLLIDKSRRENDAEHSWHFALMAMTLSEYAPFEINLDRIIRMALVHDLVEIYAGDTFAYDTTGYQSKEERENEAANKLFSLLPPEQGYAYRTLWEEFDAMQTPDALYASAIDRLQPFINNSLTDGHTWVQHGVTVDKVYKRMAAVKEALPALWGYIENVINENLKLGRINPAPSETDTPSSFDQLTDEERRAVLYPIILTDYNPDWVTWYDDEKVKIAQTIGTSDIARLRHYGSTSIPGMFAKPTVDILLEIPEKADLEHLKERMTAAGYICLDENGLTMATPPPHLMFIGGYLSTGFAERVFHIHVQYYSDTEPDEIIFRDYLIAHPETAKEYADLKRSLWKNFEHDRDGYTEAKGTFIRKVTEKAKEKIRI